MPGHRDRVGDRRRVLQSEGEPIQSPGRRVRTAKEEGKFGEAIYEVLTGQSIMLMAGLLVIGYISTCIMPKARVFAEHRNGACGGQGLERKRKRPNRPRK